MQRLCDTCRDPYEARSKRSRFCSDICRAKNKGKPPGDPVLDEFVNQLLGGEPPHESEVVRTTREALETAGRLDTYLGQTAMALARGMGQPDTGSAKAALARQLLAVMDSALDGVAKKRDPLDEVDRKRREKLGIAG